MAETPPRASSRYALVLLSVTVALAAGALYERSQVVDLTSTVNSLQAQLADRTKATALTNQEKCAQRAAFLFRERGYNDPKQNASYESHFNEQLNTCFAKIRTSAEDLRWTNIYLVDAINQRDYGNVFTVTNPPRSPLCQVTAPGQPKLTCSSEEEFEDGIRAFME